MRTAPVALLLALASAAFAQEVRFDTTWFKSENQLVLRLQTGNWLISADSPALRSRRMIRMTDASTGRPVAFELISFPQAGQRLRAIDLRLTEWPAPRSVTVTVAGLNLEDRYGRRLTTSGSATAYTPIATIAPVGPWHGGKKGSKHYGLRGDPEPTPSAQIPRDVPTYNGTATVAGGSAPPDQPTASATPETKPKDGNEIPKFPFPPPMASASEEIPRELVVGDKVEPVLGDARSALEKAFKQCGYGSRSYYAVPNGFAMASQIEQMGEDGSPLPDDERWSVDVKPLREFSLRGYFEALFRARPGHYRVVVFIVTDKAFTQTGAKVGFEDAQAWLGGGMNKLPPEIRDREYTDDYTCTALIYEFKCASGRKPQFVEPSEITAEMHLERSGLLTALQRGR